MNNLVPSAIILLLFFMWSCTEKETIVVPDNTPPIVNNVPTVKIENYVNRLFIDLLGREPLDAEMDAEVEILKNADLTIESRKDLIIKLQTDTSWIVGDTSYKRAYFQHLYDLSKVRCLEGASDGRIRQDRNLALNGAYRDSIDGNWTGYYRNLERAALYQGALDCRRELFEETIRYHDCFSRMINNGIYDLINMNSFNFVNATFDNLLWRFPSNAEFTAGFDMVEFNIPTMIFGQQGENKEDYIEIITNSREMFEGLIIWAYQQILARNPTTEETTVFIERMYNERKIQYVQQEIMVSNEYANF